MSTSSMCVSFLSSNSDWTTVPWVHFSNMVKVVLVDFLTLANRILVGASESWMCDRTAASRCPDQGFNHKVWSVADIFVSLGKTPHQPCMNVVCDSDRRRKLAGVFTKERERLMHEIVNQLINQEVDRRKCFGLKSAERVAVIRDIYQPLHPHLYHLEESFLAPTFKHIVEYSRDPNASKEGLLKLLGDVPAQRVYRFPVFEKKFCEELLQELEHFEQSAAPKGRPNTMNHYGILLNELNFDQGFITPLRDRYLHPITALLYPDWGGHCLDSQKAFVVKYDMNEDLDLSYHYDNAEITLNVSLGKDFTDGNLYFGNMRQVPLSESECTEVQHRVTEGLLHRGQHMHGALPISSGQRWNLIIWMRASQVRNKLCPMCQRKPSLLEGDGYADGFTCQNDSSLNALCLLA